MKQILYACAFGCILLASCGTGKKLKAANSLNEALAGQVNELNAKVSGIEKENTQLKQENTK